MLSYPKLKIRNLLNKSTFNLQTGGRQWPWGTKVQTTIPLRLPSIAAEKLSWVLKSASPSEEELFYRCVRDAGSLLLSCLCLNATKAHDGQPFVSLISAHWEM